MTVSKKPKTEIKMNPEVVEKSVWAPIATQVQVDMAVRQFMRNEFLPKTAHAAGKAGAKVSWTNALGFFRQEMAECLNVMFRQTGSTDADFIRRLIAVEVSNALCSGWSKDPKKLNALIEKAIETEVRRQVTERLNLSVNGTLSLEIDRERYTRDAAF